MARICAICSDDRLPIVNSMLAAGRSLTWIEKEMKNLGKPTKSETVSRHLRNCLNDNRQAGAISERGAGLPVSNEDFALAVRAEAQKMLNEGRLSVRTEHGLTAQALLDRRAEKQADRRLMVELAGLLSGARRIEGPPDDLIVGEWSEVPADGMAPLALVAGDE